MAPVRASFGDPRSAPRADPRRDAVQPGTAVLPCPAPRLRSRALFDVARFGGPIPSHPNRPIVGSPPEAVLPSPATRAR